MKQYKIAVVKKLKTVEQRTRLIELIKADFEINIAFAKHDILPDRYSEIVTDSKNIAPEELAKLQFAVCYFANGVASI